MKKTNAIFKSPTFILLALAIVFATIISALTALTAELWFSLAMLTIVISLSVFLIGYMMLYKD